MLDLRLYVLQRITALVMVPLVLGHIAMMIFAIQGGLSVAEILSRTQGSLFWAAYYGLFVVAVSVHGAIGLRVILHEWLGLRGPTLISATWCICLVLLFLGLDAVYGVTFA